MHTTVITLKYFTRQKYVYYASKRNICLKIHEILQLKIRVLRLESRSVERVGID